MKSSTQFLIWIIFFNRPPNLYTSYDLLRSNVSNRPKIKYNFYVWTGTSKSIWDFSIEYREKLKYLLFRMKSIVYCHNIIRNSIFYLYYIFSLKLEVLLPLYPILDIFPFIWYCRWYDSLEEKISSSFVLYVTYSYQKSFQTLTTKDNLIQMFKTIHPLSNFL